MMFYVYQNLFRFLVDDVPIRWYPRRSAETFPLRPMWIYGSIWDASSWATEDGKYKADYRYQPFVGQFRNFKVGGCTAWASRWCHVATAGPSRSGGLTSQQRGAMRWVQSHYLVYNYCKDSRRDLSRTPECLHWEFHRTFWIWIVAVSFLIQQRILALVTLNTFNGPTIISYLFSQLCLPTFFLQWDMCGVWPGQNRARLSVSNCNSRFTLLNQIK